MDPILWLGLSAVGVDAGASHCRYRKGLRAGNVYYNYLVDVLWSYLQKLYQIC